jgi:chitinase
VRRRLKAPALVVALCAVATILALATLGAGANDSVGTVHAIGATRVIGYYPSWATYERNYQVSDIPADQLTHINVAFANVADGKCIVGDSYADTDKAFVGDSWDAGVLRGNFHQLEILRAAHPKLRTLISIGGWTWSANFSQAAATPESRRALSASCVDFMTTYGFDGIDIDWEYPVSGGLQSGSPQDRTNYTLLLREFRTQLDVAAVGNRHYLLTVAAPAGPQNIANLQVDEVGATVDWINLMTYDYHGGWDTTTGHNAPMARGVGDRSPRGFSVKETVNAYLKGGVPAAKLVLGIPFYGRGWQEVSATRAGLYQQGRTASIGTWEPEPGMFDYTDIAVTYLPKMKRTWDPVAQVPTLYDPVRRLFITYDDPTSIAIKAEYVKAMGLGGAMIWELSGDRDRVLLDILDASLS